MRYRLVVVVLVVIVATMLVGCGGGTNYNEDDFRWEVLRSPLTGKCYETANRAAGYLGFLGMDEIDCSYYEGDR